MSDHTDEWRQVGYTKPMMSSSFLRPPSPSVRRAYHFMPSDHAVATIELRRLKVSRFAEVNDPFELLAVSFHDRKVRKVAASFKRLYNDTTGLLCFSRDWANPVLWSHYAAKHTGVCLGFDLGKGSFEPVEYKDKRLREALPDDLEPVALPADLRARLACTKSYHWAYEEEIRVFVNLGTAVAEHGRFYWPFSDNLRLAEVILGPRCDLALGTVRDLVGRTNLGAVVFKARLAFRSFEVRLDGRTTPAA